MPCDERKLYHAEENRYKESPRSHRPVFAGHRLRQYALHLGQIPIDPATGDIHGADITEQAETGHEEPAAVLEEAGTTFENAVKTTCFLADMGDFAAFNAVYGKYFTEKPARSCVAVKTLPKNVLVEVEVIAAL